MSSEQIRKLELKHVGLSKHGFLLRTRLPHRKLISAEFLEAPDISEGASGQVGLLGRERQPVGLDIVTKL